MPMLRQYGLFTVEVEVATRDRIEDGIDEFHYSPEYRKVKIYRLVAPCKEIARAWVMDRESINKPELRNSAEEKIDSVILAWNE